MYKTSNRGFTLIELLVVIAIIGILSAVVLTSLSSAREKARDARRFSDMRELGKALELYNNDNNGKYPVAPASPYYLHNVVGITPTYMSALPMDPIEDVAGAGNDYRYYTDSLRVKGYSLAIYVEKTGAWCRYTVGGVYPAGWASYPLCEQI